MKLVKVTDVSQEKDDNVNKFYGKVKKEGSVGLFLRVYHLDKKGVTAWEEVQEDELPKKVKEKLGVK